jgi:peptidyl-prolyl cis-trans isomerase C
MKKGMVLFFSLSILVLATDLKIKTLKITQKDTSRSAILETNSTQKQSAKEQKNSSENRLFSIDNKTYTLEDFPPEYQKLSLEKRQEFISKYLFYELILEKTLKEQKKYKTEIEEDLKKEEAKLEKRGINLAPIQKILFDKKIIVNTMAYYEALDKNPQIKKRAKEFYEKHKREYLLPKRVEISEIVLKDKNTTQYYINEIKKNKNPKSYFVKLAEKYSISSTGKFGGYVGEVTESTIGKEIFDQLWREEKNKLFPNAIKDKNYFHIVYILDKYKEEQKSFQDKREVIQKVFLKRNIYKWKREKFSNSKKEKDIKFYKIKL